MGLFDFIGGGGGGYSAKIDYTTLEYPGNELATLAQEGTVPTEMTRKGTTYKVATFAGGCFWGFELAFQRVPGVAYTAVVRTCLYIMQNDCHETITLSLTMYIMKMSFPTFV
jgi:hypothetical protein